MTTVLLKAVPYREYNSPDSEMHSWPETESPGWKALGSVLSVACQVSMESVFYSLAQAKPKASKHSAAGGISRGE